jgi:glycosyltransferase involved in cell wall biosynthesis
METPLVTITIPTYNSAETITRCLKAIQRQTYKNIEINIVDKKSHDNTLKIAKRFGIKKIKKTEGSLLTARYEGTKIASGEFVLILDSDQILEKNCIKRALQMVRDKKLDMLAFEEDSYNHKTFVEKLFNLDRKLINSVNDLSPFTGVIMPRFFRTELLKKAYGKIPKSIFPNTGGPDHAIVYYECWLMSKKIGVLPKVVKHIEPKTILQLWPKFYRWGYTSVDAHFGKYKNLMVQKERFRTGLFTKDLIKESFGSILLLVLKGVGFKLGYYHAKLDHLLHKTRKY